MAKNILIIDDDPNICRLLSESLRIRGYRVDSFASAEPGMDALLKGSFDLALIDILLPGLSGLETCRALRTYPATSTIPIVLMTAFYKDAKHIQEAKEEYGATEYLLKPFSLNTLFQKIEDLTGPTESQEQKRPFSVHGTLVETPIAHLLHNLYTLKATGLLHLERQDVRKVIYIREGYPIFVRSNLVRECLGQMLVNTGRLTEAQLKESLERIKETGHLQGTVLIEMGLLSPHETKLALKQQVMEKLLETFSWETGQYKFIQAKNFKQSVTTIEMSPAALILQGIRRYYSAEQVAEVLDFHRDRYLVRAENPLYRFQDMNLGPRDAGVLRQCRGDLTLEQHLDLHPLHRTGARQLLAALLVAEMVESLDAPLATPLQDEDEPELAEENHLLRDRFLCDYGRMIKQDYFTLLGLDKTCTPQAVRKAYFLLVKKYHPDHFFKEQLSEEVRAKVNELFQRISQAYSVLGDPLSKSRYIASLQQDGKKDETSELSAILQAETAFQKADILLKVKKYPEALEQLQWAIKLAPKEPEYLTNYAWALYKSRPEQARSRVEARQVLLRSAELNPRLAQTHLYLGYLLRADDKGPEAERAFETALQCNPDCTEALRELRLIDLRRKQEAKPKGMLKRFFNE